MDPLTDAGDSGEVSASGGAETTTVSKDPPEEEDELDTRRAIAAGIMGIIVGAIVTFAFTNIGRGPIWFSVCFFITFTGVGYLLYSRQETTKLVVGMGLYITAPWMPLVPIMLYMPLILWSANSNVGLWGVLWVGLYMILFAGIGTLIGGILAVIGYFIRKGERE